MLGRHPGEPAVTVCIAAKFRGGVLCATDTAVTTGGTRLAMNDIKGFALGKGFAMYAGTLYYAQEIRHAEGDDVRARLKTVLEDHKEEADEDGCSLLSVTGKGNISIWEHYGSEVPMDEYAAIGSGADLAMFGLDLVYSPDRSEKWLREHINNIITKIERRDVMVFRPIKWYVVKV
jgi:20S proteasome alpha/beta subunit